jgi:simple sugar transport system ATP-binding protein
LGIGLVHQHFMLVDTLNAVDNLRLAHPRLGRSQVEGLAEEHGLQVPLDPPVGSLSVGERQRVEIL